MLTSCSSIPEILTLLVKPLLSLPLDYCSTPVKIFDDFLPFFADHELPYHVLDSDITRNMSNDIFFAPNMNDVVIKEWTKSPNTSISFHKMNGNLSSFVDTDLGKIKIRMIINGSSVQSDNLESEFVFSEALLRNFTYSGEIAVNLNYYYEAYLLRINVSSSSSLSLIYESAGMKDKLEHIIAKSFERHNKTE